MDSGDYPRRGEYRCQTTTSTTTGPVEKRRCDESTAPNWLAASQFRQARLRQHTENI